MTMRISKDKIDTAENVFQKLVLKDCGETVVAVNSEFNMGAEEGVSTTESSKTHSCTAADADSPLF